jgi:hypothetical protein
MSFMQPTAAVYGLKTWKNRWKHKEYSVSFARNSVTSPSGRETCFPHRFVNLRLVGDKHHLRVAKPFTTSTLYHQQTRLTHWKPCRHPKQYCSTLVRDLFLIAFPSPHFP